jgi:hypothetical protein
VNPDNAEIFLLFFLATLSFPSHHHGRVGTRGRTAYEKTVQAWIKGWGVMIRLWVILFIAALPMYPLHIITSRAQRASANSTFPTGELLAVLILVLVLPFAFY